MQCTFSIHRFFQRVLPCLFLSLGLAGTAHGQSDSLTAEQAVRIVLARNPSIAQAKATLAASRAHTQSLNSAYYPQLDGTGSVANIYPDKALSLAAGMPGFYFAPEFPIDVHLGVSYTVFDFGKRTNAVASAQMAETSGVNQLSNLQLSLSYQIVQLFHVAILQEKRIGVKDTEIADRERHVAVVKRRVETGSATEFDALQSEELLAAAKSSRIDMLNTFAKLQAELHELLGFTQDREFYLAETPAPELHRLDGDSLISSALQQRSDYAAAKTAALSDRLQVQRAKLENMPSVGVQATAGYKNGLLTSLYSIDSVQFNWTAGVEVNIPIYDGERARYHRVTAEANVDAADAGIKNLVQQIRIQVLQAKSDVEAAYAKLDLSTVQVQLAERALGMAHIKYDAGVITNLDVLDAERDCADAKLGYVTSQYQYLLNCYALDQATGMLYRTW